MAANAPTVAVLGTGIMGAPMARNLAGAGLGVRAWNRTREKAEPLARHGVEVCDTAAEAVSGADFVVTMLADGEAVAEVMGGVGSFAEGATWIQTSTVGLRWLEKLAEMAGDRGVDFVDAPVLGTRQPAEEGKLVVLAAGPDDATDRADAVFEAIGSKTVRLAYLGEATRLKLALNSWVLALVEATAELLALTDGLGLDRGLPLEVLEGGPLDSAYLQMKGKAIVEESFEPSFPLKLAAKDARLVLEAAEEAGVDLPAQRALLAQFERAAEMGLGDEDMAAVWRACQADGARAESIRL